MPQSLIMPLQEAVCDQSFGGCVDSCIMTSGCTASRASVAGACIGALASESVIPQEWLQLLSGDAKRVAELAEQLVSLRASREASNL